MHLKLFKKVLFLGISVCWIILALNGTMLTVVAKEDISSKVIFIDSSVKDYDLVKTSIKQFTEVIVIDSKQDGLKQISKYVSERKNIEIIHIISHGASGKLIFGNGMLSIENMDEYNPELQLIKNELDGKGKIFLYGCDIAKGEKGKEFIKKLADTTGAIVAASDDATGSDKLGGDWNLEVTTGKVNNAGILEIKKYSWLLATTYTFQDFYIDQGEVLSVTGTYNDLTVSAYDYDPDYPMPVASWGDGFLWVSGCGWGSGGSVHKLEIRKTDNSEFTPTSVDVKFSTYQIGPGQPYYTDTFRVTGYNAQGLITTKTYENVTTLSNINVDFSGFANITKLEFSLDANVFGIANLVFGMPNNAPTVTAGGTTAFTEQTQTAVTNAISINDNDGDADWNNGTLKVQITANNTTADTLSLPTSNSGGIWLDVTTLMSNTTVIGTASASSVNNGTAWTFSFNGLATNALVQSTARAILFNNNSDAPSTSSRTVTFTATDKNGSSTSATRAISITRVNDSPTGLPTISGTAAQGQTLTANIGAISDVDGLSAFGYKWQVSNDGSSGWTDIVSATTSTYTLAVGQAGKYVRVQVSYTDLCGTPETLSSSATVQVSPLGAQTASAAASSLVPGVGSANNITLTVKNSLGNTDTNFSGAKNVIISGVVAAPDLSYGSFNGSVLDESSAGAGQTISVTFNNGVAVPNLVLNKSSLQTISFNIATVATPDTNTIGITPVADAVTSIVISTQPVLGTASGDAFTTQPIVTLKDQYGNTCANGPSSSANVVASAKNGTGTWTIGGTTTKAAVTGVATFTDLTASLVIPGNGAITFTSGSIDGDSNSFTIPNKAAIEIADDVTNNSVDNDIQITFNSDMDFEGAITEVKFNGTSLTAATDYVIENGKLTLKPSGGNPALTTPATGNVVIIAT
ncbi:DUF4347 domain-containing protein, partial [Pseudobacteroides cellulosolvens]|uniref:DUF4347 domain-containing protein n=1 Tax=Pseudobacteroides cellulosolvens TaxID=35825 RepID=UPI00055E6DCD